MRALALAVLLLAPALAGCLSQSVQPAEAPGLLDPLADVAADLGAEVTRTADAVTIVWAGVLLPGVAVPLGPDLRSRAGHPFTVGPGVGSLNLTVEGVGALQVIVEDADGLPVCIAQGTGAASCEQRTPPTLAAKERWSAVVVGDSVPQQASQAFTLTLVARPGPHASLGDLAAGVAEVGSFLLSDTQHFGVEPTVGVARSGAIFTMAFASSGPVVLRSRDRGATWEELRPLLNDLTTFDPFLYLDARTNRLVVSNLRPDLECSFLSWSDDEGATWFSHPHACISPAQDHQKLTIGGHPGMPPPVLFDGTMYYSSNEPWTNRADQRASALVVSRSLDGGLTWTPSVAATGLDGAYRTGGPIMADLEGNVYVPMYLRDQEGGGVDVVVSHDFGARWQRVRVAEDGMGSWGIDPDLALDDAGNVYLLYESRDHSVKLAVSKDRGATWSDPVRVAPPAVTSVRFVAGIGGAPGKLAIAYLGTPDTDRDSNLAPPWTRWHLYASFTDDALAAEPVFRTQRLTPALDPVQLGLICTRGVACTAGRNLADFIDATLTPEGLLAVSYTDGCDAEATCAAPKDSTEARVRVALELEGPRLR